MKYQIIPVSGDTFQIVSEFRGLAVISKEVIHGGDRTITIYETTNYSGQLFKEFLRLSEFKSRVHIHNPCSNIELVVTALNEMHGDIGINFSNKDLHEVDWIVEGNVIISHESAREYKAQYIHYNEAKDYEDVVQIPLGFNDTLRKVVRAHINYIKATQADTDESETDSRAMHDLHTWEAFLSHPLSINISQKKIDSFCNVHGIDFPIFN